MDLPMPPSRVAITTMIAEWFDLYRQVPPPIHPIPLGVQTFLIYYSILKDEYISWAVRRLCLNRSGGPSLM